MYRRTSCNCSGYRCAPEKRSSIAGLNIFSVRWIMWTGKLLLILKLSNAGHQRWKKYLMSWWSIRTKLFVPASQWMMAEKGSKKVELEGVNNKRQITAAVFAGSLMGDFLPVQLVYEGTTSWSKCYPSGVDFPADWLISATPNHWCNYPSIRHQDHCTYYTYSKKRKRWVYRIASFFDKFKGQTTDKPAKDFLRAKFCDWYVKKIFTQLDEREGSTGNSTINPVHLRLSVIKPIGAQWMIELYYYLKDHPQIIINGFKEVARYLRNFEIIRQWLC